MKDIKDYLHFYFGQLCEFEENENTKVIKPLEAIDQLTMKMAINGWIKPILRPLSSMTDEDFKEAGKYGLGGASNKELWLAQFEKFEDRPVEGQGKKNNVKNPVMKKQQVQTGLKLMHYTFAPLAFTYLLSKGFDLFELIESGLAIEKAETSNT